MSLQGNFTTLFHLAIVYSQVVMFSVIVSCILLSAPSPQLVSAADKRTYVCTYHEPR